MEQELTRAQVDARYKWDLTHLYESDADWDAAYGEVRELARAFAAYEGTLAGGRACVLAALDAYAHMGEKLMGVTCYAMLRRAEDSADAAGQAMDDRSVALASEVEAACAFLMPQLQALEESELEAMIADADFADYDALLRHALRMKPHTFSEREERLLAMTGEMRQTPYTAYTMLADADIDLGMTRGEEGKRVRLTDARFRGLLSSGDRSVRRGAYLNMMAGYAKMGYTIAALYAGQVKTDLFMSAARGYKSAREAFLYPDGIEETVYDSLIDAVHGGLGTLREYLRAKKELLGVSRLHLYDLYARTQTDFDVRMGLDEAFDTFIESVAPLGEDYQRDASRALAERWIDAFETKNKTSGAFCAGGASWTTPYVLLNHKDDYDGLSTLCHEMGHAMHSFYSNRTQPPVKADYTIFVAEVASTLNEVLLFEHMKRRYAGDRAAQRSLIGAMLENFRTTVFRQAMFAEFEHRAHEMAAAGESLTRERLCALYLQLNKTYYGGACAVDEAVQSEWMRIPHFYSPYYVYQYATGFCAAVALAKGILSGDAEKLAAYRRFLTLGGSLPPLEELRIAGVDMSTPQPVCEALDYFAELLLEYRALLGDEAEEA